MDSKVMCMNCGTMFTITEILSIRTRKFLADCTCPECSHYKFSIFPVNNTPICPYCQGTGYVHKYKQWKTGGTYVTVACSCGRVRLQPGEEVCSLVRQ